MALRRSTSFTARFVWLFLVACGGGAASVGTVTTASDAGGDGAGSGDGATDASGSADGNGSVDGSANDDADASTDDANGDSATGDDGASDDGAGDAADGDGGPSDAADGGNAGDGGGGDGASDAGDGGGDGSSDAKSDADSGIGPCAIGNDIREVEPNDTLVTATQMPAFVAGLTAICGNLAAGGDADYVQFKVPATAGHLYWEYSSNVTPIFYVDGIVNNMQFLQTAKPYVVKLVPASGLTPPLAWTFKVDIN